MILMQSCRRCKFYSFRDGSYENVFLWKLGGSANHVDCRAAADVLYEVLTIMVKKGPLSIDGRSHEL